jgi:hypothetical protein
MQRAHPGYSTAIIYNVQGRCMSASKTACVTPGGTYIGKTRIVQMYNDTRGDLSHDETCEAMYCLAMILQ